MINAQDEHASFWMRKLLERDAALKRAGLLGIKRVSYGLIKKPNKKEDLHVGGSFLEKKWGGVLSWDAQALGSGSFDMNVAGAHNASNALGALACALSIGIKVNDCEWGLGMSSAVQGRLERKLRMGGGVVIDD